MRDIVGGEREEAQPSTGEKGVAKGSDGWEALEK